MLEIRQLKKELAEAKKENEFLKKAAMVFSAEIFNRHRPGMS